MEIIITRELSSEVLYLGDLIGELECATKDFFSDKTYGNDLNCIYLSIFCMSDKYAIFFSKRLPKYQKLPKKFTQKGVELFREGISLSFELRLDFDVYQVKKGDAKLNLAKDILKSCEIINDVKAIKDFDYDSFKSDFFDLFKKINWLEK